MSEAALRPLGITVTDGFLARGTMRVVRAETFVEHVSREEVDARQLLTERESARLQALGNEHRRLEWLCGRLVSKALVMDAAGDLSPRDIEILPDESGAPRVRLLRSSAHLTTPPPLSISHSKGRVVAALLVGSSSAGLGVDVEKISPRSDAFMERIFTERELRQVDAVERSHHAVILRWALKEAAIKALGLGLPQIVPREIEVTSLSGEDGGAAALTFHGRAARRFEALRGGEVWAAGIIDRGFALAECLVNMICPTRSSCV